MIKKIGGFFMMILKKKGGFFKKSIKAIGIVLLVIILYLSSQLGYAWVKYVNNINEHNAREVSKALKGVMGTGKTEAGMSYRMRDGSDVYFADYRTMVFQHINPSYFDFGILYGDETNVDVAYHFFDIDTSEEIVYKFNPLGRVRVPSNAETRYKSVFLVEDNENKLYFRYKISTNSDVTYGAYIYNFDTGIYEMRHESEEREDSEFYEMGWKVFEVKQHRTGGLFYVANLEEINGSPSPKDSMFFWHANPELSSPGFILSIPCETLPEKNERLYRCFPRLKEYKECGYWGRVEIVIQNDMTYEEMFSLFVDEEEGIVYEGAYVEDAYTVDGLDHDILSYDDFIKYWDEEKAIEIDMRHELWDYSIFK